jgi:hypothetical protein
MKKFIITSLLTVITMPLMACAWWGGSNYYLYCIYDRNEFSDRSQTICSDNWKAYLGMGKDDWFWFDEKKVVEAAQAKNDPLMVSYVQQLSRYLQVSDAVANDRWDYPTKDQLMQRRATLEGVRSYAQQKLKTRLRSQHALLFMRCNMLLKRHAENVTFWENTASQYIETVYKDMMKNIYAGALYNTGQQDRATDIFVEQGDYRSLMTIYYEKRSCSAIQEVYMKNPNARVLPFLMQDFVNNAQEADDASREEGLGGKLFIRDISATEARQMIAFCQQVLREGKTETPAMWQSAKAWLEYMFGDKQQSLTDIRQATDMAGTQQMADCARTLRIYIESALVPQGKAFDNWLAPELQWLNETRANDDYLGNYQQRAFTRIVQQVLAKRYEQEGDTHRCLALYQMGDFGNYANYIDTTSVDNVLHYVAYLKSTPKTALDRYLQTAVQAAKARSDQESDNSHQTSNINHQFNDLIGTKHLRLCQWDKAIEYLSQVPAQYYSERGYAPYAVKRKTSIEPWVTRQWLDDDDVYGSHEWKLWDNPKLIFAKEMQMLESGLNFLSGQARQQRCYDLAIRYAQVNFTGDCWFIMRDGKSPYNDTVRPNETDLAARCRELLTEASKTNDARLKERALFALAYGELLPAEQHWFETEWDSNSHIDVIIPRRSSTQWLALARLADFEKTNSSGQSQYVTKCDEYDTFMKWYK